jgi:tRNA U34 5-methylaminomethyl-2-thiouridine-forming methyltransferase MnmC
MYRIVKLPGGAHSVHSLEHHETFHPVVGPAAEAEALYVRQLRLAERVRNETGPFVIWDVGLGAAANVITVLDALKHIPCSLHLLSFDLAFAPLEFALDHTDALSYLAGYEGPLRQLIANGHVEFANEACEVNWQARIGDFPSLLAQPGAQTLDKPHTILFDAFSPATNPAMWTQPLFTNLLRLLTPARRCALPTYSRSTMLRVTLLLAGFFVGVGHATGRKEETTVAANTLELIEEPLGHRWLQRARRSTSAEPLWEPIYRQAPISDETWQALIDHPQFAARRLPNQERRPESGSW